MIDTHAHLAMLKRPLIDVLERARTACLEAIINVAVDLDSAKEAADLAKKYSFLYASIGIHPLYAEKFYQLDDLLAYAQANHESFVAIGEAGLDYKYGKKNKEDQFKVLHSQFQLAQNLAKPLILHTRQSDKDMIQFINLYPDVKTVVHCFSSNIQFIDSIKHENFCISFNGMITTRLNDALIQVIQSFPLERMMLETDCPYLTPKKYGQAENEPSFVTEVAPVIARIKNISEDQVNQITTQTAKDFFEIH